MKHALVDAQLSQKKLSILAGFSEKKMCDIINGKSSPKIRDVETIAKILKVLPKSLLTDED
jgi:transcriptional regulator with XRE-family HTH domain